MKYVYESDTQDGLTVTEASNGLDFMAHNCPDTATVRRDRDDVRNLRDALNRWLDEQQRNDPNPAGRRAPAEPPYTALVRRLVAEEVARVLPLHQSPQAVLRCDGTACCEPHPRDPAVREYATNTGLAFCADTDCDQAGTHAEHDPEPQAVGHPEAPAVNWSDKLFGSAEYPEGLKFDYCVKCGHSWGAHVGTGGPGRGCTSQLGKDRCGCTRTRGTS